jgi:hypothetical protein
MVCNEKFKSIPFKKLPGIMVAMKSSHQRTFPEVKWPHRKLLGIIVAMGSGPP